MGRKAFKGFYEEEPLKIYLQIQLSNNKHVCMANARSWLNQTDICEYILKFKMFKSVKQIHNVCNVNVQA